MYSAFMLPWHLCLKKTACVCEPREQNYAASLNVVVTTLYLVQVALRLQLRTIQLALHHLASKHATVNAHVT
eukprot:2443647-Amphidinium_carterae.1